MATRLDLENAALDEENKNESASGKLRNWEVDQLEKGDPLPSPGGREPINVEEELLQQQEKQQELEEQKQRDRMQALQEQEELEKQNSPQSQMQSAAKQAGKDYVKKAAKKYVWEFLAATSEIWGPIVAVIAGLVLILGLVVFIITAISATCNESSAARWASWGASFLPGVSSDVCAELKIAQGGRSGGAGASGGFTVPGDTLADAAVRAQFAAAGLSWNKNCIDQARAVSNPPGQTCFGGMRQATVNELIEFKQACDRWAGPRGPCSVVVTGGTELGVHASGPCSHESGHKADIGTNTLVNQFIRTTFGDGGRRGSHPAFISNISGVTYVDEGNHWDIGGVGCA